MMQLIAEQLVEAADVRAGQRVLDGLRPGQCRPRGGPPQRRGDRGRLAPKRVDIARRAVELGLLF